MGYVVRGALTAAIGAVVFLLRALFTDIQALSTALFTVASVFFPILIASVLAIDITQVKNRGLHTKLSEQISDHKRASLVQYLIVAIAFLVSFIRINAFVTDIASSLVIGAAVMSVFYDANVGLFHLPKLRHDLSQAIQDEIDKKDAQRFRGIS